jgi:hypothetical protein
MAKRSRGLRNTLRRIPILAFLYLFAIYSLFLEYQGKPG